MQLFIVYHSKLVEQSKQQILKQVQHAVFFYEAYCSKHIQKSNHILKHLYHEKKFIFILKENYCSKKV